MKMVSKIAVTSHAVDRYRSRVAGAEGFSDDSIREIIRDIVRKGFEMGMVRQHPYERARRIIPFKSGSTVLYLSIGKNTTSFQADVAVIGVLFEKEVSNGKVGLGVTLGDLVPELKNITVTARPPRYAVFIGLEEKTIEHYRVKDEDELRSIIRVRKPKPEEVAIYRLIE